MVAVAVQAVETSVAPHRSQVGIVVLRGRLPAATTRAQIDVK